jgi:DNA-directed RNA polymerase subunit RPC12/RpoP
MQRVNRMKLTIPTFSNGKLYTECEIRKPRGGVIADTQEAIDREGSYQAMREFVSGSIKSFTDSDGNIEESNIKRIVLDMPYIAAEDIAIKVMATVNGDDKIEGIYPCPRCGKKIICQFLSVDEDTRDRVSDLSIIIMEPYSETIHIDLIEPIIIQSKSGEIIQDVKSIDFRWPTLSDCINGSKKFGDTEQIRRQYSIYNSAIVKVNDETPSLAWKSTWGMYVFSKMETDDINKISRELKKYGMQKIVKRHCSECGKEWNSAINVDGFFASGLRQD